MRSFAENVAPNKPHGFGRDGEEGGGGGGEGEGGGGRGGGGREALRMRQTKIHPPHGGWSAPLFACQQSRPAVGLSSAGLRAPNLHHRQEYEQVARLLARILAQFLHKPREQHLHVVVVVPPARQEKSNLCRAFLGDLRLRLPQRPVVLGGRGSVSAAGTAARPPRREKPPSAPFQMASSAARQGERSCQACGGASVKSAVRGSCRLLHKKPLHISGDGRSRCVRPSVRPGEGRVAGTRLSVRKSVASL